MEVEKESVAQERAGWLSGPLYHGRGTDLALGKEEGRLEGLPERPFLDVAAAMESVRRII